MKKKYEYKFVRLGKGFLWPKVDAQSEYKEIIDNYSREGWRLVQIFSPVVGIYGMSRYYEIIFEREISNEV